MTKNFLYNSKSKIFRNDGLNLQISQIGYSHLMKQWKNSCCLSDSEFTSFGLNLVTVLGRRCFSFLSNVYFYSWQIKDLKRSHRSVVLLVLLNASRHRQHRLTHFFAIKKKEYLVQGLGRHKSQYNLFVRLSLNYGYIYILLINRGAKKYPHKKGLDISNISSPLKIISTIKVKLYSNLHWVSDNFVEAISFQAGTTD